MQRMLAVHVGTLFIHGLLRTVGLEDISTLHRECSHGVSMPADTVSLSSAGRAMELGRECLQLWGYKRVDELIWVKTNQLQRLIRTGRTGHWLNHSKEHCLVGVKGSPQINRNLDCDVLVAEVCGCLGYNTSVVHLSCNYLEVMPATRHQSVLCSELHVCAALSGALFLELHSDGLTVWLNARLQ